MFEPTKSTRELETELTKNELQMTQEILVKLMIELDELKEKIADIKKEYKAKINGVQGEIKKAHKALETGKELRLIDCETRRDDSTQSWITIRIDTGEEVSREPWTDEEKYKYSQTDIEEV